MELEESPLWNEIEVIRNEGPKPISYNWRAEIHFEGETHQIFKVVSMDNIRNYEANIGDELVIETAIPLGFYIKLVYPNRSKLEITLYKEPLQEIGDGESLDEFKEAERFKAVPVLDGLPVYQGTDYDRYNQDTLDLKDILPISFQLFNKSLEILRTVSVGGIYRNTTNEDVVKGVIAKESLKLKIDGKSSIVGLDMVESDNKTIREHTVIPQSVRLLNLSTFVQEKCNGIYKTGIGTYLQRKNWYIYPLFNTKRFLSATKTAILYKVPENRFKGTERTYRIDTNNIFILGTSSSVFSDDANTGFMNKGNGVRLADATQFMNSPVTNVDNKAKITRAKLNYEDVGAKKEDGLNSIYTSPDEISSNMYKEHSRISSRDGGIVDFVWENANPKYLIPGMMVKIIYMENNTMQELVGVLLHNHVFVQLKGKGITIKAHTTTCRLSIFVNKVRE